MTPTIQRDTYSRESFDPQLVYFLEILLVKARRLEESPERVSRVQTLERMLGEAKALTGIVKTNTEVRDFLLGTHFEDMEELHNMLKQLQLE